MIAIDAPCCGSLPGTPRQLSCGSRNHGRYCCRKQEINCLAAIWLWSMSSTWIDISFSRETHLWPLAGINTCFSQSFWWTQFIRKEYIVHSYPWTKTRTKKSILSSAMTIDAFLVKNWFRFMWWTFIKVKYSPSNLITSGGKTCPSWPRNYLSTTIASSAWQLLPSCEEASAAGSRWSLRKKMALEATYLYLPGQEICLTSKCVIPLIGCPGLWTWAPVWVNPEVHYCDIDLSSCQFCEFWVPQVRGCKIECV